MTAAAFLNSVAEFEKNIFEGVRRKNTLAHMLKTTANTLAVTYSLGPSVRAHAPVQVPGPMAPAAAPAPTAPAGMSETGNMIAAMMNLVASLQSPQGKKSPFPRTATALKAAAGGAVQKEKAPNRMKGGNPQSTKMCDKAHPKDAWCNMNHTNK